MTLRPAIRLTQERGHSLQTGPTIEPVTVAEFRSHLRATVADVTQTEAEWHIEEAREYIESASGLAMIDQTWRLTLDAWPGYAEPWWDGVREGARSMLAVSPRSVILPRYPLSSITSVTTYDEAGTSTAVTVASVFDVDTQQKPGRMALQSGQTWPLATRPTNAIEIDYVAGYGTAASNVPASLRRAVLALAAYLYEHRGECDAADAYQKSGASWRVAAHAVHGV